MRKMFLKCLCLLLALMYLSPVSAEELRISGISDAHDAYQLFTGDHPDMTVIAELSRYRSDTQLVNAFLSREFVYDVFSMNTASFHVEQLFAKGYCADLSSSDVIRQAVFEMHPSIQKLVMFDDAIYGLPYSAYISFLCYDKDIWDYAGLSEEDVPDSFPALLDFLENWLNRVEDDPDNDIGVYGLFDESMYSEASYTNLLTTWLVNEHIMQCSFANEPLRFDTPDFLLLLSRCKGIGRRLYDADPTFSCEYALFTTSSFMTDIEQVVSLRLNEQQPELIRASLSLFLIYAGSEHKERALEFIEDCLQVMEDHHRAFLFSEATPVENEDYEGSVAFWQGKVDAAKMNLETVSDADRRDAEIELERLETILAAVSHPENRYLILPEQLASYQAYGNALFFQPPSVFSAETEEGQNVRSLISQFSFGQLPADMLAKRMNELAIMLENEQQ